MGPDGRVLIPAEVRRMAGLEPGMTVVVRLEGECVVLMPREAIKPHRCRSVIAAVLPWPTGSEHRQ